MRTHAVRLMTRPAVVVLAALTLAATLLTAGPAAAAPGGSAAGPAASATKVDIAAAKAVRASAVPAKFAAEGRSAGLTAAQQGALQGKVDAYLTKLGPTARQSNFNTIALKGADIHVAVPGEAHPRTALGTYCAYKYFCAYSGEWQNGDDIHMYDCGVAFYIPWYTTGSWVNNQTRGTRPVLQFTDYSTWVMPAAYAQQLSGVGWSPVLYITAC